MIAVLNRVRDQLQNLFYLKQYYDKISDNHNVLHTNRSKATLEYYFLFHYN